MTTRLWARIFRRLERDILDRRGIKWEWGKIERKTVTQQISPAWRRIVAEELSRQKGAK